MSATETGTVRIALSRPSLPPLADYAALLQETWDTGRLSNGGPHALRLEAACAALGGWRQAIATSSADLGLTLTVAALGLPVGARVLVPSLTFPSTVNALLWNGLHPCFTDVEEGSWCLDPEAVAAALDEGPAALVLGTHAFGAAADVHGLARVTADAGIPLVFDGAHALATTVAGQHVGRHGSATVFSLSPTKLAPAGEGGMVATDDGELAARLRLGRTYGRDGRSETCHAIGLNAKLSELHAALGVLTLARIGEEVAAREILAGAYARLLGDLPGVRLQHVAAGTRPSRAYLAADLGRLRDGVALRLAGAGIETRRVLPALHRMPAFAAVDRGPLPVTECLDRGLLCLPLHADLGTGDVAQITGLVHAELEQAA